MSKKPPHNAAEMRLYSRDSKRLYLNETERHAFIATASNAPPLLRLFCLTLAYSGCRHSEARFLRWEDVQLREQVLTIRTLKRRKEGQTREVPIPEHLAQEFHMVLTHHLVERSGPWLFSARDSPPSRSVSYRWVKHVMAQAGVKGAQACPKGLRHAYGVHATKQGVQLHMLQKWMGHASMETTAIYATALGPEELEVAKRMW